jgi:hypothetical protein
LSNGGVGQGCLGWAQNFGSGGAPCSDFNVAMVSFEAPIHQNDIHAAPSSSYREVVFQLLPDTVTTTRKEDYWLA